MPLSWATYYRHEGVVKLLIRFFVPVSLKHQVTLLCAILNSLNFSFFSFFFGMPIYDTYIFGFNYKQEDYAKKEQC